jgi:two-component system response regulator QseB
MTAARILVVEDDRGIATMLERGLRLAGHEVVVSDSLGAARAAWVPGAFALVLLDVMLPDGDGIDLLAERRAAGDDVPAVLLTAREAADLQDRAGRAGASAYLPKPFAYADLLACIDRLIGAGEPPPPS